MRKIVPILLPILLVVGLAYTVADLSTPKVPAGQRTSSSSSVATQLDERTVVTTKASAIVTALAKGDMKGLSTFVHPKNGVRFSPYADPYNVDMKVFSAAQIAGFASDTQQYSWGYYDGREEAIELKPKEYFAKFVSDHDYSKSTDVRYDEDWDTGNTIDNSREEFPLGVFVDYHIPATEEGGMDWAALRLVFEEYEGDWYIVGIVHNQWTI